MLLEPLEEGLHLPYAHVETSHLGGEKAEGIRKKSKVPALFLVVEPHQPELPGVFFEGGFLRKHDFGIAQNIIWQTSPPSDASGLQVLLRPHDEERLQPVDPMKHGESVVAPVEHVVRTSLVRDGRHGLRVVGGCRRDVVEGRHMRFQIVEDMGLHPALVPAKLAQGESERHRGIVAESNA